MAVRYTPASAEALLVVPGIALGTARGRIKAWDRDDVVLVIADERTRAGGVFTRNRFSAAPVHVSRRHLVAQSEQGLPFRALVVNAGNANAGTGEPGAPPSPDPPPAPAVPKTVMLIGDSGTYDMALAFVAGFSSAGVRLVSVVWMYIFPNGRVSNVWDNHAGYGIHGAKTGYDLPKVRWGWTGGRECYRGQSPRPAANAKRRFIRVE